MWSEELNKKIQDGENNCHPTPPDKAWDDMEVRLDKHLPLKKKRRRFIFFLLPVLLGAGLATFYFRQKTDQPEPVTAQKNTTARTRTLRTPTGPAEEHSTPVVPGELNAPDTKTDATARTKEQKGAEPTAKERASTSENIYTNKEAENNVGEPLKNTQRRRAVQIPDETARRTRHVPVTDQQDLTVAPAKPGKDKDKSLTRKTDDTKLPEENIVDQPIADGPTTQPVVDDSSGKKAIVEAEEKKPADSVANDIAKPNKPAPKTKSSFGDRFSLNFSFGPDISAVGIDNPGQVQFQYGIGAGYAITKNLAVRTGFYAGAKKYTADSSDYHTSYPINKLEKVEADCYVYEIPLNLVYSFNPVKKHNWFVAGGVSSYIMKKETYEYYYKNAWGQPVSYAHSYKNENKHLFSVIDISGGYQYHLSNRLSLLAEPYVRFPVSGIGAGKVKLNNAGLLFTVSYKPFSKK